MRLRLVSVHLGVRLAAGAAALAAWAALGAFEALAPRHLAAQTTGRIEGRVSAPGGIALGHVAVTATGAQPGTRTVESDAAGAYRFAALPPGTYNLRASLSGYAPQESTVIVSLGATTTADFQLTPAVAEEVTVRSEAPLVDIRSTEVGTTMDAKAFERLPLTRDYTSIALLQPGVTTDGAGFSVLGNTGLENSYYIDGVDVTGLRTGAEVKVIPEQFLQEVEVKTATYSAEYGRAFGGVVNAITRSGGNSYHGEAFGYFDNHNLQSKAKTDVVGTNFAGFTSDDFGAGLGGYLLRDRLWFFGVYDRTALSRDVHLVSGSGSPFDGSTFRAQDRAQDLYATKLTFALTPSQQLVGSVIGDHSRDAAQLLEDGPPQTRMFHEASGQPDLSLIDTAVGSSWVAQVGAFRHQEKRDRTPDFNPPFLTTNPAEVPTVDLVNCPLPGCYSGAPWVIIPTADPLIDEHFERDQLRGSLTGYLGGNEVKGGFDLARAKGLVQQAIPGGYFRTLSGTQTPQGPLLLYTQTWFGDPSGQFGAGHAVPEVSGRPRTDYGALYLQDNWTPRSNLTINAGLRYDQFRLKDAVTGSVIANLNNNFGPRLGVVWDPSAAGRQKVSFAYGRFFEAIPLNHQAGSFAGTSLSITDVAGYTFDCGPTSVSCQSFPNRVSEPADPHLKAPESDELSLTYKQTLGAGLTLGVQAIYSKLLRAVEDRCDVLGNDAAGAFTGNGCVLMNPGSGSFGRGSFPAFTFPDGTTSPILCTNGFNPQEGRASGACLPLPAAKRTFEGVALTAEERFSAKSYLLASYLYSRLRGNYDGTFNELGQASPNTNLDFDYPGLLQNAYGKLANDRPSQAKVTGYYSFDFGLTAGLNVYYRSGTPLDRIGSFALSNGAPIPLYLAARGSQGRTPADYDFDLHADYPYVAGPVHVDFIIDLFRVLNRQAVLRTNPFFNFDGFMADNGTQTNPQYGVPILRADPRLLRFGMTVSF
jgi:outer membrane receptor protein involved in Fe transport